MIEEAVKNREAIVSANGALATWTPPESTGRSPKDTYIVRRPESEGEHRLGLAQQHPHGARDL